MKITKLYTYPIKGMMATELDSAVLTKHGFAHDRRFLCLQVQEDGSYKNMAVAHFPELTLYFPSINVLEDGDALKGTITITYKPPSGEQRTLDIPLKPKTDDLEETEITMHHSPTKAYKMKREYNDWLSSCLGYEVVLVHLGDNLRKVLMSTSGNKRQASDGWLSSIASKATQLVTGAGDDQEEITFADCAPYLVVSDKSMDDIHNRLPDGEQFDLTKFRPNIVCSGAEEIWEEDFWGELTINNETKIECEQNCARCKSINIDYATGKPGTTEAGSMLKKMNSNRRVDPGMKWSPVFGRYSFLHPGSDGHTIRVGDDVQVSRRNAERTRFDWEGICTK